MLQIDVFWKKNCDTWVGREALDPIERTPKCEAGNIS